ncbi:hypothetical protein NTPn50_09375 [Streptococcus pneumoniae]|uniref:ICE protein n=1 Tax=Streptococcus pneumoniae TaxID=1313 RepID=A0A5C8RAI3_STREE|nr:hypothetical protein NTPn50_09375 [Streptococcus pneumoniae]PLV80916.1 hypothetical protein AZJ80_06865 [Streptococcus pneumoniae]PLV90518.1 hypothetical protein AZJ18_06515 [Streptococcus pneumoniae]PLV98064.1 hypothetical protein AZJ17_05125 [Streptococcus pneumoniae]TVV52712.1 hypothetical protein AZK38_01630 [Streptococcus pneumoniae]
MESVKVAVVATSQKKEKGWIKVATLDGRSWTDMGAHFDKEEFGELFCEDGAGLYEIEFKNVANFGENSKFEVVAAKRLFKFSDLLKRAEGSR